MRSPEDDAEIADEGKERADGSRQGLQEHRSMPECK